MRSSFPGARAGRFSTKSCSTRPADGIGWRCATTGARWRVSSMGGRNLMDGWISRRWSRAGPRLAPGSTGSSGTRGPSAKSSFIRSHWPPPPLNQTADRRKPATRRVCICPERWHFGCRQLSNRICPFGAKCHEIKHNAMNTKVLAAVVALAALLGAASAFAQAANPENQAPAPNQVVYLPQLPGAADLARSAPGQGVTIAQITQTSDQVTVVYKLANGQTSTVAYRLLSAVESSDSAPPYPAPSVALSTPAPAAVAPATAVVYAQPAPAVVYGQPAPVYYAPDYYWPWYGPIAVNLGFGWGWRGSTRCRLRAARSGSRLWAARPGLLCSGLLLALVWPNCGQPRLWMGLAR